LCAPNSKQVIKLRKVRWTEHVARTEGEEVLVGETAGKTPLVIFRRRWKYNIKMRLTETGRVGVDWTYLVEDSEKRWAVVTKAMNLGFPQNVGSFLTS